MADKPKSKNWISKAIKPSHKGLFGAKAKAAGKTTRQYAEEKKDAGGKLGKEANFAMNAMNSGKKSKGLKGFYGK